MTARITLIAKPGCHLCDEARAVLTALQERVAFTLTDADIEADDELFKRLLERIPVIALDGEELYDFFVDAEDLELRLRKLAQEWI